MLKSPLRYPGGKSRATALISNLIPDYKEFREPFVGGGSVFIQQQQSFPQAKFWINDLYKPLFIFWKQSQKNIDLLIQTVQQIKNDFTDGKTLFYHLKENYNSFTELEKAAAFFIFNRITFSGTSDSGGFSEAAFKERFTESSIQRLRSIEPLLAKTKITNGDYEPVIAKPGKDVFIFLDPPYYAASKSALYGKNGHLHKSFEHERFATVMKNCKHNYLITYDDSPYIRKLFSFANIFEWNLKYGMRNVADKSDQNGRELFISNYLKSLPN